MKKSLWIVIVLILACVLTLSACGGGNDETPNKDHVHSYGEWTTTKQASCVTDGINERYCSCGEKQTQTIGALGHNEVVDVAVAATCTTDGKTEGKHCGRCSAVLISQTLISSSGHKYNNGEISTQATCNQNGVKTFTCTVNSCRHSYTESYSLPTYTATELYNLSVKYVGEIVTYDKSGAELALGTGFVISSDGKIVTNYHVIDGAHSADITINNKKYTITKVLAYDENIDLAVVKVNATGLTTATICKKPVSVGATVYAIGSSRGLTNTYSQGIITYANRVVDGVSHVQHDASITHGNSGGPLINVYGEVIGINTWGISDSQNLNFAVFTAELDNLVYGTPMTLAEFYENNLDPYEALLNWLVDNDNSTISNSNYISYNYYANADTQFSLTYKISESVMYISIIYPMGDNYFWTYFEITPASEYTDYYGSLCVNNQNSTLIAEVYGRFKASTLTSNTEISYDAYYGSANNKALTLDCSEYYIHTGLDWLAWLLSSNNLDITLYDLGFKSY